MKITLQTVSRVGLLVALALALQALGLPQPITGPGVNAVLYVASLYIGPLAGALVGVITPWVGLMTGKALAVAVPVIIAGNVTLALVSGYLSRFNRYVAMLAAALAKFGVMTAGIRYLLSTGAKIPPVAYTSLTVTQLFTALGGALVAAVILVALPKMSK
ncbi:MAG: ECF transporter S component [Bacillota bacterium]|jgi:hypothetical protein